MLPLDEMQARLNAIQQRKAQMLADLNVVIGQEVEIKFWIDQHSKSQMTDEKQVTKTEQITN